MLLVVDLLAVLVFFAVDLLLLLLGQRAAVGGALVVNLLSDVGLVLVGPGRFAGSHLAAAQAVGGALLLVGFAVVDFVRLHGVPVVLFVVDLTAGGVLLAVDLLTLLTGELATVRLAIVVHLLVDVGLRALGAGRFAGSHLAAAQAVGDALVLIGFTGIGIVVAPDRAIGGRDGLRLRVLLRHLVICVYVRARHGRRTSMIHRRQLRAILRGKVLMLHLVGGGLEVVLVGRLHLHRRRMHLNARAAVEADVVDVHDRVLRRRWCGSRTHW